MSIKKTDFPLALCMIQPEPCPGSYRNTGMSFQEVMDISIKEVEMIQNTGFDGYIIPVSYTHLDVYKRQVHRCSMCWKVSVDYLTVMMVCAAGVIYGLGDI